MIVDNNKTGPGTSLLLEDLRQFAESLWRNEEIGEKRFNFFLTFLTAVVAGLVALHTAKDAAGLSEGMRRDITNVALAGLFLLGIMTYLRMLRRNRVSDQYQRTLKYIREQLRAQDPSLEKYKVPVKLIDRSPKKKGDDEVESAAEAEAKKGFIYWTVKWLKGGLAETVGALNAFLLFGLLVINCVQPVVAAIIGGCVLVVLWVVAIQRKGVNN